MPEVQVTISKNGLTNYVKEQLATYDGTPASAQTIADTVAGFSWEVMTHNIDLAKGHLELFIYRIQKMRDVQKQFFEGKKSALKTAQQLEARVDQAIITMLTTMGYSIEKIKQKEEQSKLF